MKTDGKIHDQKNLKVSSTDKINDSIGVYFNYKIRIILKRKQERTDLPI